MKEDFLFYTERTRPDPLPGSEHVYSYHMKLHPVTTELPLVPEAAAPKPRSCDFPGQRSAFSSSSVPAHTFVLTVDRQPALLFTALFLG